MIGNRKKKRLSNYANSNRDTNRQYLDSKEKSVNIVVYVYIYHSINSDVIYLFIPIISSTLINTASYILHFPNTWSYVNEFFLLSCLALSCLRLVRSPLCQVTETLQYADACCFRAQRLAGGFARSATVNVAVQHPSPKDNATAEFTQQQNNVGVSGCLDLERGT